MQGLNKNRYQFALLVLVNAFVGAMVGLERSIMPNFGKVEFGINANTALMSFIIAFGLSKSLSNYAVAELSKKFSRKTILITGWIAALPVPFLLMYAPNWNWVIAANILLGINQGLAWSSTVIMKIDLVGSKDRGLAMGINEFAGYLSVGLAAWLASSIAMDYGYAYFPFIPGIIFSVIGLLTTIFLVKDTSHFVHAESLTSKVPMLSNIWKETTWKHRNLGSVSLNGLVNNLNDGVVWGLMPVLLMQKGFGIAQIGIIAGIYPAVWGISQLITGKLGDSYCKKQIITSGMLLQALAIIVMAIAGSMSLLILASVLLGLGTALVYPNFLSVIAEWTHPAQRAESLSIFRLWRDSGYVFGAVLSGILADLFGITNALFIVALITAVAGMIANKRMCCSNKIFWKSESCVPAY
ncbi:MFS transporter [Daejeonella sp. H1SJ63]|jgi:MFS family permease|uniref:MFS transporter n=1 Tax=Daejeonella sp. H1SJ63 TaxID=3034145 RepID=UPI0023EDF823|nr:MFS transporter [Daejeonella sp. H1SJ63]